MIKKITFFAVFHFLISGSDDITGILCFVTTGYLENIPTSRFHNKSQNLLSIFFLLDCLDHWTDDAQSGDCEDTEERRGDGEEMVGLVGCCALPPVLLVVGLVASLMFGFTPSQSQPDTLLLCPAGPTASPGQSPELIGWPPGHVTRDTPPVFSQTLIGNSWEEGPRFCKLFTQNLGEWNLGKLTNVGAAQSLSLGENCGKLLD